MAPETLAVIEDEAVPKGDVIATARLAGIMAAKRTHELIPLCHQLNLTAVSVDVEADRALPGLRVTTRGAPARAHRSRDGGAGRGVGGRAHDLRHVQGDRPRHGGHGTCACWRRAAAAAGRGAARSRRRGRRPDGDARRATHERRPGRPRRVGQRRRREGRAQAARGQSITLVAEHGVEGDAHAGPWHRQVSLLANESIEKMKPACPDGRSRRLRREHHDRGHRGLRAARGHAPARRRHARSRSPRSARSATTAAPSSTRPATASCRARASSCASSRAAT